MQWSEVKDSGNRQEFTTGAVRDTEDGKGDYSLLPWIAIRRLALHLQNGAKKYGRHNWRKGMQLSRLYSASIRHLTKWWLGYKDEDHLAAVLFNVSAILEIEEMISRGKLPQDLDDRLEEYSDDYIWSEKCREVELPPAVRMKFLCDGCNSTYEYDVPRNLSQNDLFETSGNECPGCAKYNFLRGEKLGSTKP